MKKEKLKIAKGFTFLEALIAIFIISFGLLSVLGALTMFFKSTYFSYNRIVAQYLAQEGLEMVRNIRDTNWLEDRYVATTSWREGLTDCINVNGCQIDYTRIGAEDPFFEDYNESSKLKIGSNGFYQYDSGNNTIFSRKITITPSGNDILIVKVDIFWKEREKDYSFSLQKKLFKYNFK